MIADIRGPDPEKIRKLFGSIASRYDRANDVITMGLARRWRQALVDWSEAQSGDRVLDVATGTGDLALAFKDYLGSSSDVIGTDFCDEMLAHAPKKAEALKLEVQFRYGDAMALPFSDREFHVVSIAYGIRNVSSPISALREMVRVTKPGGRVMVLETGDSPMPLLQMGMRFYLSQIVPRLGGLVTGEPQAYQYLSESSSKFPSREKFLALMEKTGAFSKVEFRSLLGGASFIYKGTVRS